MMCSNGIEVGDLVTFDATGWVGFDNDNPLGIVKSVHDFAFEGEHVSWMYVVEWLDIADDEWSSKLWPYRLKKVNQ